MVRRTYMLTAVVAIVATGTFAWRHEPAPALHFDSGVPGDVRALAATTWEDFLAAMPARLDCIDDVTLAAAWELDSRGQYVPATATLTVRIPGTAGTLRDEMIHEFAHHVDFTCPQISVLRPAFIAAQGMPAATSWFDGDSWEETPSEQFAEAAVAVVLGRRPQHGSVHLTTDAVALVRAWGLGS